MKSCELCKSPAETYCESDSASLCWECDAKVHGANFLVARHTRSLLCKECNSPTAWKASGVRLGRIVSVCDRCATEEEESDGDLETDADNDEEEEEEEGENQVVPWASSPPCASSSSSEDDFSRKRTREDSPDLQSQNESYRSTSTAAVAEGTFPGPLESRSGSRRR